MASELHVFQYQGSLAVFFCPATRDDLVSMYIQAMQDASFSGVYNATAPNPVRMSELCSSLGSVLGRPSWLPVPDFALTVRVLSLSAALTHMPPARLQAAVAHLIAGPYGSPDHDITQSLADSA